MSRKKRHQSTIAVQSGIGHDPGHNAITPPVYLTSTYEIDGLDERGYYEYSRTQNPSRDLLAKAITELEGGYGTCVTASGMAALTIILHLLNSEDLIIAPFDCYGRSHRLLNELAAKGHFRLKFTDQYSKEGLDEAFSEAPKMVLVETPSNPVMRTADIADIVSRAKKSGAITVVDNTFLSPALQNPIALGADIVFHSTTKFLNGHSDVVGGCVISASQEHHVSLGQWNNSLGTIGAPFDSYLTLRGLRTLNLRLEKAQENAGEIAAFLKDHKRVKSVYYPGLKDDPNHAVAKKQQKGFGAMLSFELEGTLEDVNSFVQKLEIFRLAQSLGGTESLINHPASMTHVSMGQEARDKAGVTDQLLRLSIGIETIEDLIDDLRTAFAG